MKWEKYSQMTQKQRDEFNYRFQYKIDFGKPIIIILMLFMLATMFMSESISLYQINPALAKDLISNSKAVIYIMPIAFLLMLLYYIIYIISMEHKKDKWLKDNGI